MDSLPTCLLFLLAFNGILGKAGLKSYVTSLSFAGQGCLAVSVATQSDFTVCVHAGPRSISWGDEARSSSAFFTLLPDLCTAGAPERMRWGPWSSLFIRTLPSFRVWSRLWFAERWPLGGCPSPSRPPGAGCPQELRLLLRAASRGLEPPSLREQCCGAVGACPALVSALACVPDCVSLSSSKIKWLRIPG